MDVSEQVRREKAGLRTATYCLFAGDLRTLCLRQRAAGELTRKISSDGRSVVTLVGKTAPESDATGLSGPGTTIHYHVDVQFFEHGGFGKRSGKRSCTLTFIKM